MGSGEKEDPKAAYLGKTNTKLLNFLALYSHSSPINPQNPRTSRDKTEAGTGATTQRWDASGFVCAAGEMKQQRVDELS